MKYLLDTCTLSELTKRTPNPNVIAWLSKRNSSELAISSITIGELQKGIDKLESSTRKSNLLIWLNDLEETYNQNILPFNTDVAKTWGQLTANLERNGTPVPIADSMIAATALHNHLIIVTRNIKDFQSITSELISPWE